MAEPLLSSAWYRVVGLRPRLSPGAGVARQTARDHIWHILTDAHSGRQLRLNAPAYGFAGRCDGTRTVGDIWALLLASMGDAAPGQDDILRLLSQLYSAGMVQFDAAPNLDALFAQRTEHVRRRRRAWINPLVVRMSLFDPTPLLDRLLPRALGLFSAPALALWALCVAFAALLCAVNFA